MRQTRTENVQGYETLKTDMLRSKDECMESTESVGREEWVYCEKI